MTVESGANRRETVRVFQERLSELILDGQCTLPIEPFGIKRFLDEAAGTSDRIQAAKV